jgi:hypothetical protein
MRYFKYEIDAGAEHDTVYLQGETPQDAAAAFVIHFGNVPRNLLTVTEIRKKDLPKGESFLE